MARRTSEHEARILDFEEARRPAREQSTRAARPSTRRATHTASSRSSARGESSSQPALRSTGAASSSQAGSVRRSGRIQSSAREESFCRSASTASSRHSTRPHVSHVNSNRGALLLSSRAYKKNASTNALIDRCAPVMTLPTNRLTAHVPRQHSIPPIWDACIASQAACRIPPRVPRRAPALLLLQHLLDNGGLYRYAW